MKNTEQYTEQDLIELGPRVEQGLYEENNDVAWSREYVIWYRYEKKWR